MDDRDSGEVVVNQQPQELGHPQPQSGRSRLEVGMQTHFDVTAEAHGLGCGVGRSASDKWPNSNGWARATRGNLDVAVDEFLEQLSLGPRLGSPSRPRPIREGGVIDRIKVAD
jgi:hypothetical protein